MARKAPSFGQLIDYLGKGQSLGNHGIFSRNLFAQASNRKAVKNEFKENFSYLKKRVNGNILYHEIIVLDQGITAPKEQLDKVLFDLAERYCRLRAPKQIVYGRIHNDKDHHHIHLIISANPIKSPKRVRLSKKMFSEIQQEIEKYLMERYPELEVAPIYTQSRFAQRMKVKQREGEMERRTGKPSKKRFMKEILIKHLSEAQSFDDLENRLKLNGMRIYQRGKQTGLEPIEKGRRFRLKTLGIDQSYKDTLLRFKYESERKKDLVNTRSNQTQKDINQYQKHQKSTDARTDELLRDRQVSESFAENHLEDFGRDR